MPIPADSFLMWFTSFLYLSSAILLIDKMKLEKLSLLFPISLYFFGISAFFGFMGIFAATNLLSIALAATLSVMFGSSFMARLPLRMLIPKYEEIIFSALLLVSVISSAIVYTTGNPYAIERAAHIYGFIVAGIFSTGYLFYLEIGRAHV